MADMTRVPDEGYDEAYSGMGFGTGADALEWLVFAMTAYPKHNIPVWVDVAGPLNPEAPDFSIGVLLPQTGESMIVYAITAAQEEIDEARQLVENTLVARAATQFARG